MYVYCVCVYIWKRQWEGRKGRGWDERYDGGVYFGNESSLREETRVNHSCLLFLLSSTVIPKHKGCKICRHKTSVQIRVNIAGLMLLSLQRPACKVGPLLASRNLDLGRILNIPKTDRNDSSWLNCLYN